MQTRYKAKLRRWAECDISEPFDVVVLDTKTGTLHCSPRTLSEKDAESFHMKIENLSESCVEFMLAGWNPDGTSEDFDNIEGRTL